MMIYKWGTGVPPWTPEGAAAIGVAALIGTLMGLIREGSSRYIRLRDGIFTLGMYSCPLSGITNVHFSEIDNEWFRVEFDARKGAGRTRKFIFGMPRDLTRRVTPLLGIDPDSYLRRTAQPKAEALAPSDYSSRIYELHSLGLGVLGIFASMVLCFEAITARNLTRALICGLLAICSCGIGVVSMHSKAPRRRQPPKEDEADEAPVDHRK
jgi:hypothetical protein